MREVPETLTRVIELLHILPKTPGEYEHIEADLLLCDALRILGRYLSSYTQEQVAAIIDEYDSIEKWHA